MRERTERAIGGSPWRRRLLAAALAFVALAAADQIVLHLLLDDGVLLGRRIAPYDPPLFHDGQRRRVAELEEHLRTGKPSAEPFQHDRELGWAPPRDAVIGEGHFDWAGTRIGAAPLAREKQPGVRRVAAMGCSFTLGQEVAGDRTWAPVLDAAREDLELANLGMGAYGVDQALLRYLCDGRPLAPDEVWLGIMPNAVLRVTTLYRPAQWHWDMTVLFKPGFVFDEGGELALIENPGTSLARTLELIGDQEQFFAATMPHDSWVRRFPAAYAPESSRLLHRSALARILLTAFEVRGRDPLAALADPASEAHRLIAALCRRFRDEARADGARFRVLILPGEQDLADQRSRATSSWSALSAELAGDGIEVIDLAPDLPAPGEPGWDGFWAPGRHYSVEGNRRVAELLARAVE